MTGANQSPSLRPKGFPRKSQSEIKAAFPDIEPDTLEAYALGRALLRGWNVGLRGAGGKRPARTAIAMAKAERDLLNNIGTPWPSRIEGVRLSPERAAEAIGRGADAADLARIQELSGWSEGVPGSEVLRWMFMASPTKTIRTSIADLERQAEHRRETEEAKAEIVALSPDGTQVPLAALAELLGCEERLSDILTHPNCGFVRKPPGWVKTSRAVDILRAVRREGLNAQALTQLVTPVPGPAQMLSIQDVGLGVPDYVVALACGEEPRARRVRHDRLDAVVKESEADSTWAARATSEANAAIEQGGHEVAAACMRLGLDLRHSDTTTTNVAKALNISTEQVRKAIKDGDLPGRSVTGNMGYGRQEFWRVPVVAVAKALDDEPAWLTKVRARRRGTIDLVAGIRLPLRRTPPSKVEVFLGPTNSGKTHQALGYLAERGAGTYAAPLRMLAYEAYERLVIRLGNENVGLVTGEERVNAKAPIICATAEMAPMRGELLVLDEVQWAADPERGWAWTRLLAGAEVDELYVTGEVGAAPLVRAVLGDDVPITFLERLCPLEVAGGISLGDIPDRSCVVAFSRKAVLHVAGLLRVAGRRVSVLYGALPPEVRRTQVQRLSSGEADVIVATDVIGHGVNLPIDAVVFAETEKFDGTQRRALNQWEAAQIAGRAGRYGLSEAGRVFWLTGEQSLRPDPSVVKAIGKPKQKLSDGQPCYRLVDQGQVGPGLDDLAVKRSGELPKALTSWEQLAQTHLSQVKWAKVGSVQPLVGRLGVLARAAAPSGSGAKRLLTVLSVEDAWRLARSPLDHDDEADAAMLTLIGQRVAGDGRVDFSRYVQTGSEALRGGALHLERRARELVALRWATLAFEDRLGISHGDVSRAMNRVTDALNLALDRAVEGGVAHCVSCGKICAPWFTECDSCHSARRSRHYGGDWDNDAEYWDPEYDEEPPPSLTKEEIAAKAERTAERKRRLAELDGRIEQAVEIEPLCGRPDGMQRQHWADKVVPAILAAPSGTREQLRADLIQKYVKEGGSR
ncbi:MAG: helicase-related protein [Candidatus Dormibacteria bacterium]